MLKRLYVATITTTYKFKSIFWLNLGKQTFATIVILVEKKKEEYFCKKLKKTKQTLEN